MALSSTNLNDHLYSTNLSLGDLFNNHTFAHDPSGLVPIIDSWAPQLQNSGIAVLDTVAGELNQLKSYIQAGDRVGTSTLLQRLGEQSSKAASNTHEVAGNHLHNGLGDQLRHLGQLLIMASGNLKVS
ncbi:hypothetical protein [Hymenobacter elongatus]|uniref:Uncharacterized protein n=1 Tax=Hymenobacter elongatus TaxID=877208 RepID=A0A4Z0PJP1_9BACT|nr:hypothetical protein [Hymenobacter elongatus]TGE15189.1 hypothetical protein E5J99_13355 [Hymenobacter elongatus]